MEDNMYPVGSEKLTRPPKKQQDREVKAKLAYETERPYLHKILEYLQEERERYASIASIKNTDDAEKFMLEVKANQKVVEILETEINYIGGLVKKYDKD